jgi:teichuronic acid biosynthesis glycosyltransferase TuaC
VKTRSIVTWERQDSQADVLVVTTAWPEADDEMYGIPVKRQMETLFRRGLRCDVLYIRGYRSPLAYFVGALRLASWGLTGRRRYRLVHAHGGEAALVATFYRRAPVLVTYLGSDLLGAPRRDGVVPLLWRLRRAGIRQHARLAARTITESEEMEAVLPAMVRKRNLVVAKGVATALFHPSDRADARRELGWDPTARIALFAADPDVALKRHRLAEAAIARARRIVPDLLLEVARGVPPDRMPLLMNAADCLLHTSFSEGSPNVVKEALMCDLPVVATAAGDIESLLRQVTPSYLCPSSETAIADALVECLREPRRSNGFEMMSRRLDVDAVADSLLEVYDDLAPGFRQPCG